MTKDKEKGFYAVVAISEVQIGKQGLEECIVSSTLLSDGIWNLKCNKNEISVFIGGDEITLGIGKAKGDTSSMYINSIEIENGLNNIDRVLVTKITLSATDPKAMNARDALFYMIDDGNVVLSIIFSDSKPKSINLNDIACKAVAKVHAKPS